MPTPLSDYLTQDHARLRSLLRGAIDAEPFDAEAFERFRAGLLRHIGIEEKLLLPDARRRRGAPLPSAARLRIEHAAIASLMVPTPDRALALELEGLLARHDALEEGPEGVYAQCEALAGQDAASLLERARAAPAPPLAAHFDGKGVHRTAADALVAAERSAARAASAPRSGG